MRVTVVHRSDKLDKEEGPLLRAIQRQLDATMHPIEGQLPTAASQIPSLKDSDVCIWIVAYRQLATSDPFDWQGWDGLRVMYDWDTIQNYWSWSHTKWFGTWPDTFRKHKFDLLVSTSRGATERFNDEGVPTICSLKGVDTDLFRPLGLRRSGLGTYGVGYPARSAARISLVRQGVRVERFRAPFAELNDALNRYSAVLVNNAPGLPRRGARFMNLVKPGLGVAGLGVSPDVMGKSFEVLASGSTLLVDWTPEFSGLGLEDGASALFYQDLRELPSVWKKWKQRPDDLTRIGQAGAEVVAQRHTWTHRVKDLKHDLVERLR